jgi:hypothetical protein
MAADKAGDVSLQKILDGLYKVAIGIDELRNRYGRDHGRDAPQGNWSSPCAACRARRYCLLPSPTRHAHRPESPLAEEVGQPLGQARSVNRSIVTRRDDEELGRGVVARGDY